MQIKITKKAQADIKQIAKYIAKDSLYYTEKTVNEIYDKIYSIVIGLNDGTKVMEFDNENIRQLIYKKHYRIIFEIRKDIIYVRTVWHTSKRRYKC